MPRRGTQWIRNDLKKGMRRWISGYALCRRRSYDYGKSLYFKAIEDHAIHYNKEERAIITHLMDINNPTPRQFIW